jgi:hypothetical protein
LEDRPVARVVSARAVGAPSSIAAAPNAGRIESARLVTGFSLYLSDHSLPPPAPVSNRKMPPI